MLGLICNPRRWFKSERRVDSLDSDPLLKHSAARRVETIPLMHSFDFVVIAPGGGPSETNISAYMLKSREASWKEGIVAVEAGSGIGVLAQLLQTNPHLFHELLDGEGEGSKPTTPLRPSRFAAQIYSYIQTFLISHAHLDHINSLILTAGSLTGRRKHIAAIAPVIRDIETVFSNRLWPNLASWEPDDAVPSAIHKYVAIDTVASYHPIGPNLSVRVMPISHGKCSTSSNGTYESSAFFIKNDITSQQFLFFGDVEPDSVAAHPATRAVWRTAVPLIIDKRLSTIFLECSWPESRDDNQLYGHLSPKHVVAELKNLAKELVRARRKRDRLSSPQVDQDQPRSTKKRRLNTPIKPPPPPPPPIDEGNTAEEQVDNDVESADLRGSLEGLRLYVIHCKDRVNVAANDEDDEDVPIGVYITSQVRRLIEEEGLGIDVQATSQGMRIEI